MFGPLVLSVLLAATSDSAADLAVFAQFGAVGIIAAMGIWFAKGAHQRERDHTDRAHQRERDRADRLEAENRRLNDLILERVIPGMAAATSAAEESAQLLAAIQRERELERLAMDHERRSQRGGGA